MISGTRFSFATQAVLLGISLTLAGVLPAADWHQFRGPTGQGTSQSTNVPVEWDQSKNVVWKESLEGQGWSSPVLSGGRIYLTSAVPLNDAEKPDLSLQTVCLNQKDGKVVWAKQVFQAAGAASPKIHSKNSPASPTPVVDNGRIYVHFGHQGTACLSLEGKVLWRNDTLSYKPVHGNGGSPVLHDGKLFFSIDGAQQTAVIALNADDGSVAWRTERNSDAPRKFSFTTPAIIEVDGKPQLISPASNVVHALNPTNGEILWFARYDGYSVIPRPVYGNGLVYICTGYNTPSLLAIRPTGKGDVTETHVAWTLKKGIPHTPSLMLLDQDLYMVSDRGIASCLNALTGESYWQQRIGSAYSASPVHSEGKIYFLSEDGITTVVKRSREFKELAVNKIGERTLASFAPASDTIYIRTAKHLIRVGQ